MKVKLTRCQVVPDLLVAFGERVEDPSASGEEPLMSEVVVIGQRPEAVNPESDSLHLGAVEPVAKMVYVTFSNLHIGLFAVKTQFWQVDQLQVLGEQRLVVLWKWVI